jgi:acylphosphatase
MKIAVFIKISGDVQGVSYRYFARTEAKKLGLSGYAKNGHDGTVSIFIQGPEAKVAEFVEWTKKGSPMASVENVEIKDAEADESIMEFEVK